MSGTTAALCAAFLATCAGGAMLYAFGIEPRRLKMRRLSIASANWPQGHAPLRVAVIGDPHVGSPFMGPERIRRIVQAVNAEKPDVILLTGDFLIRGHQGKLSVLGGRFVPPDAVADAFSGLEAPHGVVSILGNHDYYGPAGEAERLRSALEAVGIKVPENASVPISRADGSRLHVAVLADEEMARPDWRKALCEVPAGEPYLVLAHDPASLSRVPDGAALMVAGHTHGGQVVLPLIGALMNATTVALSHSYGHIRAGAGRDIYVAGGLGMSWLPMRFNMPPEVAVITLGAVGDVPARRSLRSRAAQFLKLHF